jgi:general secretion pathway protein K
MATLRKTETGARSRRGSALLAVLWLSAALAAIAFSLASMVKGESERASTAVDGLRAYYLAAGGIDRASLELLWSVRLGAEKRLIPRYSTAVDYHFGSGDVHVEFLPEAGKLNVNAATPEVLYRVNMGLGMDPERAREIALAIDDWRRPAAKEGAGDSGYLALGPSFRVLHASIEEIEELLQVKGVTPDIFYGTYVPAPEGSAMEGPRLVARPGLIDCLSVYGAKDRVDANTAQPAVLAAIGLTPTAVNAILERRRAAPFTQKTLGEFLQSIDAPDAPLRLEGNSILTLRATARLRTGSGQLSDLRRTVAAQVKYMPAGSGSPIHILRWYDSTWIN